MTAGLGAMGTLIRRNRATTCVPEYKDLGCIGHDAVVELAVDAAEVNTPDAREARVARKCADTRLAPNKRKSPLYLGQCFYRLCR